jgi:hypothetical protein
MNRPLCCLGLVALALAGCRDYTAPAPPGYSVKGKIVMANGSPLILGRVEFSPVHLSAGREGAAEIAPDGTFQLVGANKLLPGKYKVTVEPISYRTGQGRVNTTQKVPEAYLEPETTPWEVEIRAEDNNLPPLTIR